MEDFPALEKADIRDATAELLSRLESASPKVVPLPVRAPSPKENEEPPFKFPKMKTIITETAGYYRMTVAEMLSPRRDHRLVLARHVAAYICKTMTPTSFPQIGIALGGRDHTTVMHSLRTVKRRVQVDEALQDDIDVITLRVRERMLNEAAT